MTFDSWQERLYPEEYLEHSGIKGMKHGRRRFQNKDGTWTEAGLEARRKREGFGETRKERKAAKRVAKLERKQARKVARNEAAAARAERKRRRSMKGLTDDELKARIARLKLENEYKDLKRSPLLETGAKLVGKYLEYKGNKDQREIERNKQKIELERIRTDAAKSRDRIKVSANEAKKAKEEANKTKYDVEGGLKIARKADLKRAKMDYKNTTIRGGISKRINMLLTSGKAKEYEAIRKAKGESRANEIKSDAARDLNNKKWDQQRSDVKRQRSIIEKDLAPERKRERKLQKEREEARKQYEAESERIRQQQRREAQQQREREQEEYRQKERARQKERSQRTHEYNRQKRIESNLDKEREKARKKYEKKLGKISR